MASLDTTNQTALEIDAMEKQIRILFICHGNICRSPMAEYILRSRVAGLELGESVLVDSAATSAEEIGNPVHPRTAAILDTLGIDCSAKRARQMQRSDYEAYDYLIGMDRMNVADMRRIAGGDPDGKICRLLDFAANPRDIADPWYTGDFDATYTDVCAGCDALLKRLKEQRLVIPAAVRVCHVQMR